ncbi:hypothetical protein [Desulfosporosinus metallidurans]
MPLESQEKWPVVEGDYIVGNRDANVAVCTLAVVI